MIEHNSISPREGSMAALALYGDLHNRDMGIKDILSEFIRMVFAIDPSHHLSESDVAWLLKQQYGFIVPISVLMNIMRHGPFLTFHRTGRNYSLNNSPSNGSYIYSCQNELAAHDESVQDIFHRFIDFIEQHNGKSLDSEEQKTARTALYSYFVSPKKDTLYREDIERFILNCRKYPDVLNRLQKVQNGIILFEGVCYDAGNPQEVSRFMQFPLRIYLDTEILFNAVGYNGELCKKLFLEFYEAVQQINQAAKKSNPKRSDKCITLFYTGEVQQEIEAYFDTAADLVHKQRAWTADKNAMRSIVAGCCDKSDVSFRKTGFWREIQSYNILCNDQMWDGSKIVKEFNVEDKRFIPEGLDEDMMRKFNLAFDQLNIVSHERRHGSHTYLGNCKSIYASHSNEMLTLARNIDNEYKEANEIKIRLCVPLQYITARLWYHTIKGLAPENPPISFSVLAKAQFVAARKTGDYLGNRLKRLQQQTSELSQDEINAQLADLRSIKTKPEDITIEDWAYNDATFNNFIEQERFKKNQTSELLEKAQEENASLEEALQKKTKDLEEESQIKEKYISEAENAKSEAEKAKKEIAELKYGQDYDAWNKRKSDEKGKAKKKYKRCHTRNMVILSIFVLSVFGIIVAAFLREPQGNIWGIIGTSGSAAISFCTFVFAPGNRKELKWTFRALLYNKAMSEQYLKDWEKEWMAKNPKPKLKDYYN